MMLGDFAVRNNFVIKNNQFPHKNIHLGRWRSPDGEIEHFLINARGRQKLQRTKL